MLIQSAAEPAPWRRTAVGLVQLHLRDPLFSSLWCNTPQIDAFKVRREPAEDLQTRRLVTHALQDQSGGSVVHVLSAAPYIGESLPPDPVPMFVEGRSSTRLRSQSTYPQKHITYNVDVGAQIPMVSGSSFLRKSFVSGPFP